MHAACMASSLYPRAIQAPAQRVRSAATGAQASQGRRGAWVLFSVVAAVWHGCTVRRIPATAIPCTGYGPGIALATLGMNP